MDALYPYQNLPEVDDSNRVLIRKVSNIDDSFETRVATCMTCYRDKDVPLDTPDALAQIYCSKCETIQTHDVVTCYRVRLDASIRDHRNRGQAWLDGRMYIHCEPFWRIAFNGYEMETMSGGKCADLLPIIEVARDDIINNMGDRKYHVKHYGMSTVREAASYVDFLYKACRTHDDCRLHFHRGCN